MIATLLVLSTLAAEPSVPAESEPAVEAKAAPQLELLIPQQMIEDFLAAAMPYERTVNQQVGAFGIMQTVKVHLRFTHPRVSVTPKGVVVTMDYVLKGPGGVTSRGRATPRMELRALNDQNLIEGKLTGARLSATGGINIPMDDLMEPVRFPAGADGPLDVGGKKVIAQGRAREVVLEDGVVRVRGDWEFKQPQVAEKAEP